MEASEGCQALAGMGVFFSGRYAQASSRPAQTAAPGGPDEQDLAQLTGPYNQSFLDTRKLIREDKDLDQLGVTVRFYGVRGLFTAQKSIVMRAPDGRM